MRAADYVLQTAAQLLERTADQLGAACSHAVDLILASRGYVVVTGMGKSGYLAQMIAADLRSAGTPALFLHPAEAVHGDLGILRPGDTVLAVSRSGETAEVLALLPTVRRLKLPLIAITSRPDSTLGRASDAVLHLPVTVEGDPLNLAPMASTTGTLAMGYALAVAVLEARANR